MNTALLLSLLWVLGAALWSVSAMERILRDGRSVLVQLAPVDPRSLMQGDYMALAFAMDRDLREQLRHGKAQPRPRYVHVQLDAQQRATLVSVGDTVIASAAQVSLKLRHRDGRPSIGANAFFFQEGQGKVYERARWGELRVADDGRALLVALRDGDLQVLGEQRR